MVITKEALSDYKARYEQAVKLVNEETKKDPPTEPFRSINSARNLLLKLKTDIVAELASLKVNKFNTKADAFTYQILLAYVCRDLGRIYVFTEETATGEDLLQKCLHLVEPRKKRAEAIIPYMGVVTEMGIKQANISQYKESMVYLKLAEDAFNDFKQQEGVEAMCIADIFVKPEEIEKGKGPAELEALYTVCSFYLAQVYGQLGEMEKSVNYCHMSLRRLMSAKSSESLYFVLHAARLSVYYINENRFKEARHHLSAATLIMAKSEANFCMPEMTKEERAEVSTIIKERHADIARCWAKYGLALLSASENYLQIDEAKLAADKNRFNDAVVSVQEKLITADYCLTFDEAKPVYHFVIEWLEKSQEYVEPGQEVSEYAKIVKDYAELYQHIAFFEEDPANQSKMQIRRAKYYEDLLQVLSPTLCMSLCRECWYGAGLSYCTILTIELDKMRGGPHDIEKINEICQNAIKHFQYLLKSFMEKDSNTLKAGLEFEEERTVLYAYFYLGRLHYKMLTPDYSLQLENMNNSLKYYKLFTEECASRKEVAEILATELTISREKVILLTLKIANLMQWCPNIGY